MSPAGAPHGPQTAEPTLYSQIDRIPHLANLSEALRFEMKVVSTVLPFRVSSYVLDTLIDWRRGPDDPIFRITFPHRDMLPADVYQATADALAAGAGPGELRALVSRLHRGLNPHPGDQRQLNLATVDGEEIEGLQHKYAETVLYFPREGQTCHSFCTFCFRWAQFTPDADLRMAMSGSDPLTAYLRQHPEVTDVLVTGGDPFVMKSRRIRTLVEPLLAPDLAHVTTIRFGTKALTFRPQRFVSDPDAEELLEFLRELTRCGKHVAVMAHFNHGRELEPALAQEAVRRLRATGAAVRTQSPILRGINDDATVWAQMWREQVRLGATPYYMFVARDTGAQSHFDLPLIEAWRVYAEASQQVSGLARTARGPVMSASPGKIEFLGPTEVGGETVYALRFLQAREPSWCHQPFFAAADPTATWFNDLKPAFGAPRFFFEADFDAIAARRAAARPRASQTDETPTVLV